MKKVFKLAVNSMKNIKALIETGIWSIPSEGGPYRALVNNAKIGDRVVFVLAGEPVVTGELTSTPSSTIKTVFPDGKTYSSTFTVNVETFGKISRKARDRANIVLPRGVISYLDNTTYRKCRSRLQNVG